MLFGFDFFARVVQVKVGGSRSTSINEFDDALKEAEAKRADGDGDAGTDKVQPAKAEAKWTCLSQRPGEGGEIRYPDYLFFIVSFSSDGSDNS